MLKKIVSLFHREPKDEESNAIVSASKPKSERQDSRPPFKRAIEKGNFFSNRGAKKLEGRVSVQGNANRIIVHEGASLKGVVSIKGNNNRVIFGRDSRYQGNILVKGDGLTVSFGHHSTTVDVYILAQEGSVSIGPHCMFSREIEIRTTDAHSVIDRATGARINPGKSIKIGGHVWVGVGAIINKGANIPDDCIVGAMSFVNKNFDEEGVALAGSPAEVVKRGVTWSRFRQDKFTEAEMTSWKSTAKPTPSS